jgi:LPS-assembly lipoprotein
MSARLLWLAGILALSMALGGCGFHPLYADYGLKNGGQQVFDSIYVEPIEGEVAGYELRNSLIDSLHATSKPDEAQYRLTVKIKQKIQAIGINSDASITRYNYNLQADYELTDRRSGKSLRTGTEITLAPYDVVASPYATTVAQHDAQKSGAEDVAYRIQVDLAVYFADLRK